MLCLLHTISQELRTIDCEFNNATRNKHLRIELRSDGRFSVTLAAGAEMLVLVLTNFSDDFVWKLQFLLIIIKWYFLLIAFVHVGK